MKIGAKIRKIRELKDLSQEFMAENLGISQQMYSCLEKDDSIPFSRLQQIAKILEVDVESIIGFDKNYFYNFGSNNVNMGTANYSIPEKVINLYEENIALLKQKIVWLEEELAKSKNQM